MDVASACGVLESFSESLMVDEERKGEEENGKGGELVASPAKKLRLGEEVNRVAEIVLVLSNLGRMRGGKTPTEFERELMVEARLKLTDLCQEFTPKEIIGKDDVRAVIEDLGLNDKLKDQRQGFRAPKLTISEKLSLGRTKMEESKKYLTPTLSTGYTSHLSQPNGSVASPGLSTLANNVSVGHQWPGSDFNTSTTVNTTGSYFIRDSSGLPQSRVARPQMMLNGPSQTPPISSANYFGNAASWSVQPHSTISFSSAPEKKVPFQSSVRVSDPSFRPIMSQTPPSTFRGTHQPMQGMIYGQTSSGNNHTEIAKIIQKVLHPRIKESPLWNPPSRDYMSREMTCQMCEVTVNEVQTLLICDACEKAYHLKCLQANNMKVVPKSEWHCSTCVQSYNGKPFPPKYGRAKSAATAKMPSSTVGVPLSTEKKVGSMDLKGNQQNPVVTTSSGVQNFPDFVSGAATTSHFETASMNANTTARAVMNAPIGFQQVFRESGFCGTNSSAPVLLPETPNHAAITSTSAMINNGLLAKPLISVGTVSSTSPSPICNLVPVNATSNAILSTPISTTLVERAHTANTGGSSLTTTRIVASSSNSQPGVSHSDHAKATENATIGQVLKANDGPEALMGNVAAGCGSSLELISHSSSLGTKTTLEKNGENSRKDAMERSNSETCQDHQKESPDRIILDKDSKIIAESSMQEKNST